MSIRISRRRFLARAGAAGVIGAVGAQAFSQSFASDSPNDQISVGVIGLGWRGSELLSQVSRLRGVRVVSLCDVDSALLEKAHQQFPGAQQCVDLRRVLDDPGIDAVLIATCNHWHCLAAIWACEAGKDVYVEKPLAHSLWEGRQLVNATRRYGRVLQTGMQQRSDPMQDEIRSFLHNEKSLGGIREVVAVRFGTRASIGKRSAPLPMPTTLDYDLWLGPGKDEPIYRDKLHYDWHWDWNTGNGECANWGVHVLDDVRNVVFEDRVRLPKRIACSGGRLAWNDAGKTPNVQLAYLDADGIPVFFALSNLSESRDSKQPLRYDQVDSGYIVLCEGGSYHGCRGRGIAYDLDGKEIRKFSGDSGGGHLGNFFDVIRSRKHSSLKADAETGHYSAGWTHLLNAAYRSATESDVKLIDAAAGQSIVFDKLQTILNAQLDSHCASRSDNSVRMSGLLLVDNVDERFEGQTSAEANRHLARREYRSPYIVPTINA